MADHRKPFRPRRLAFGGRLSPRGLVIGAALSLLGAVVSVEAQEGGLKNGAAALNAGKYDNAVRLLTSAVNSDNSSPAEAAKALYLRGIAYRKLGQPSRAIADLGAAIWLGLPGSDKVRALVNRGLAYRTAGLGEQGEVDFAAARKAGGSGEVNKIIAQDGGAAGTAVAAFDTQVSEESISDPVRGVAVPSSESQATTRTAAATPRAATQSAGTWDTSVSQGTTQEGGSRVSRWLGSVTDVFGSSNEPASQPAPSPAAAPAPAPAPAPTRTAAAPAAAPTSWATEVQGEASSGEGGTRIGRWISRNTGGGSEQAAAPTQTAAASGGIYRLQLANSRSEAEAKALLQKAAGQNPQVASARSAIEKVDIGNFGTFYSLKIGPFADRAQSQSLCNSLKRSGIDCSVVTPDGP